LLGYVKPEVLSAFYDVWSLKGKQYVSIERYSEVGGAAQSGIAPTRTQVSGLSSLKAIVRRVTQKMIRESGQVLQQNDHKFKILMPTSSIPITRTDKISWNSQTWEIVGISMSDASTGLSHVYARAVK